MHGMKAKNSNGQIKPPDSHHFFGQELWDGIQTLLLMHWIGIPLIIREEKN
jgi:hypothetical protein